MWTNYYLGHDPEKSEGRKRIQLHGDQRGQEVAITDCECREIVRDKTVLRELAKREFLQWWAKERQRYPHDPPEEPNSFDVDLMQRLYSADFCKSYTHYVTYTDIPG